VDVVDADAALALEGGHEDVALGVEAPNVGAAAHAVGHAREPRGQAVRV